MADVSRKAVKRTLNHINEQQAKTNELLEKSVEHQTKMKGLPVEDQLKRLVVIDAVGNVDPVNVDDLMRDIAELYDVVSESNQQIAKSVESVSDELSEVAKKVADNKFDMPQLQKIAGDVKLSNAKEIAKEIARIIPQSKDMPKKLSIDNFPDKQEIYGKTLVKLDGNTPQTPVAVRLTDGDKFVDLDKLFKVVVSNTSSGGGLTDNVIIDTVDGLALKVANPDGTNIGGGGTTAAWGLNNIIEDSGNTYFGKEQPDGTWWFMRIAADDSFQHATAVNNNTVSSYSDAEAAFAALNYGDYDAAF